MGDDTRDIDNHWDAQPTYGQAEADEAVTVSLSTTPGEWLVNTNDSVVVPMSMAEVVEALRYGKLTERSLVWRAGMQEWQPIAKVPQLKLAARLQSSAAPAPVAALPPTPVAPAAAHAPATAPPPVLGRPASSKPPPKPVRVTPSPSPASALATPPSALGRRSTLPFGFSSGGAARPNGAHASPTRTEATPDPSDQILAVYARPAATISFDIAEQTQSTPGRAPAAAPTPERVRHPQTLAPTTTDSAPSHPKPLRFDDLSVVAASDFRAAQKSSKRVVWLSSLTSAAAASLLTFWLAKAPSTEVAPASAAAQAPVAAKPIQPAPPPAAPVALATTPEAAPSASVSAPSPAAAAAALAKPKAKPIARRAKAVVAPKAVATTEPGTIAPSDDPNPYDLKPDSPAAAPPPAAPPPPAAASKAAATHGSGLEDDAAEPSARSSASSGL